MKQPFGAEMRDDIAGNLDMGVEIPRDQSLIPSP
jgi:hypothetical protein